jgi:hypothetical protein
VYYYKYIALCCSLCKNTGQKPLWDTNTCTKISSDEVDESWEGRVGRRGWGVTEAGKFGTLGRSRGLISDGGRKFWEVREVEKFFRSRRSANV